MKAFEYLVNYTNWKFGDKPDTSVTEQGILRLYFSQTYLAYIGYYTVHVINRNI